MAKKSREVKKHERKMRRLWRKDPVKASYLEKAEELEFNENIDDKYTNELIEKYKQGHQKNHWFSASGIISIILGIACLVGVVGIGFTLLISSISFSKFAMEFSLDVEEKKKILITAFALLPILGFLNIWIGLKVGKISDFTKEMLLDRTGYIFGLIFFQAIVGGIIFCFIPIVGYFIGRGVDYGAIHYNYIDEYGKELGWGPDYRYHELEAIKNDIMQEQQQDRVPSFIKRKRKNK